MNRRILIVKMCLILSLVLFMAAASFAVPEVLYKEARPKKDLSRAEKQEKGAGEVEQKKNAIYNPEGKTDPFVPFIKTEQKSPGKSRSSSVAKKGAEWSSKMEEHLEKLKAPKTDLQKIEISKLMLTSIVKKKDKIWAMVSDTKGKGYLLEKGTFIGTHGGIVDSIVCEQKMTAFGPEAIRKVIIKEPYYDRNKNFDYKFIEMEMPGN